MPSSVLSGLGLTDPDADNGSVTGGNPAVWTLLGEAGTDPQGQYRVASTIHNRAEESNSDYDKVVLDPKQGYEAWQNSEDRAKTQKAYPVDSPQYKAAEDILTGLKTGTVKPTTDYSFYSPTAQAARGRPAPAFDNGSGVDVAGNRFFPKTGATSNKTALDSLGLDMPSVEGNSPDAPNAGPDIGITNAVTSGRIGNTAQQLTLRKLQAIGDLTDDPKGGSLYKGSPIYTPASADEIKGVPNGSYYLDPVKGDIQYAGEKKADLGTGYGQGLGDVALSGAKQLPGSQDDDIRMKLQASQNQYDASNKGNWVSDLGRFGGQLTASIPAIAAGGGLFNLAARAVPAVAPTVGFLGGATGTGLTKIGSVAANSALQGGAQAGLTSSTSDKPLWQQLAEGFTEGGLLGPLAHGASGLVSKFTHPTAPAAVSELVDNAANNFGIHLKAKPVQDTTQHSQWLQGVGSTFGADTSKITHGISPPVMSTAIKKAGDTMNGITSKYALPIDNSVKIGLNDAYNTAKANLSEEQMKLIDPIIADIKSKVANGQISGSAYQNLTGSKSALSAAIAKSGPIGQYAGAIKDALDDAYEKVIGPQDTQAWKTARLHYKNAMTVADAIGPNGSIKPDDLSNAIDKRFPKKSIYGAGPLGTVGDIGQLFMKPSANVNPLQRHFGLASLGSGAAVATAAQGMLHSPLLTAGALTSGAAAAGVNAFMRNRTFNTGQAANPLLKYIGNQWAVPTTVNAVHSQGQ